MYNYHHRLLLAVIIMALTTVFTLVGLWLLPA
jgi:hypothetical protein